MSSRIINKFFNQKFDLSLDQKIPNLPKNGKNHKTMTQFHISHK